MLDQEMRSVGRFLLPMGGDDVANREEMERFLLLMKPVDAANRLERLFLGLWEEAERMGKYLLPMEEAHA